MRDKLTIKVETTDYRITGIEDPFCDYNMQIEVDASDLSVHQLFKVFEKVLLSMGYTEQTIMKGACALAFNEMRDPVKMSALISEYDLEDIHEEAAQQQRRKELHESVGYDQSVNKYEPV
jgi:hypothetical protein